MDLEQLIASIFKRSVLWDRRHHHHHNRYVLDKEWDAVGVEMKTTKSAVRLKWKALRDNYRKELAKITNHCSGEEPSFSYTPSWPYFQALSFLKDQFTAKKTSENASPPQEDMLTEYFVKVEPTVEIDEEIVPTVPTNSMFNNKKRKYNDNVTDIPIQLEEEELQLLKSQEERKNEHMSFFESLLPHIKRLSPRKQLKLQMKIQEVVFNAVYEDENELL